MLLQLTHVRKLQLVQFHEKLLLPKVGFGAEGDWDFFPEYTPSELRHSQLNNKNVK